MFLALENTARVREHLPLYICTVGEDFTQRPAHRPKGAPFHHIFFIEKGAGRFVTASGEVVLEAGRAVFMQKGFPISYEGVTEDFRTGWVTFDGTGAEGLLQYFAAEPFSHQNGAPLAELCRACVRAAKRGQAPEVLAGHLYSLVTAYFAELRAKRQSPVLELAKNYIEENYAGDLAVEDVASATGISASLLYRLFREEGSTPLAYLRSVRLRRAKQYLLENPKMPIAEIAARCGFSDSAYFCKVFRDAEHMTPGAYRAVM